MPPALNLPKEITVDYQPYGLFTLVDLQQFTYKSATGAECIGITGTVKSGKEISRLFQHSLTKDIAGQKREVYGVKQWELDSGHIVRVAM